MCRERTREPAWVAAIKLAVTRGRVDIETVIDEANLVNGRESTVEDILATMADRDLLVATDDSTNADTYLVGPVLLDSVSSQSSTDNLSNNPAHRWARSQQD